MSQGRLPALERWSLSLVECRRLGGQHLLLSDAVFQYACFWVGMFYVDTMPHIPFAIFSGTDLCACKALFEVLSG